MIWDGNGSPLGRARGADCLGSASLEFAYVCVSLNSLLPLAEVPAECILLVLKKSKYIMLQDDQYMVVQKRKVQPEVAAPTHEC